MKRPSQYGGITEALENSLMDDLMMGEDDRGMKSSDAGNILYLMTTDQEEGSVWASICDGPTVKLSQTTLEDVEQILVPKTDADHKPSQCLRIEGIQKCGTSQTVVRAGLIQVGTEMAAIWLEVEGHLEGLEQLLPTNDVSPYACNVPIDYIRAIQSSNIL